MSELIHYRCGGTLVDIEPPAWDRTADRYARCVKCRLPGVIQTGSVVPSREPRFSLEEAARVRQEFFESPLTFQEFALSVGISTATLYAIIDRTGAYRG